jgi:hypothetical protein
MAGHLDDTVIGSYSTYLTSFTRTQNALSDMVQSSDELVSAILRPFKTAGVDDIPADVLRTRAGLESDRFDAGIQQAAKGGLVSVENVDGTEHVLLLPIGHAALGAAV